MAQKRTAPRRSRKAPDVVGDAGRTRMVALSLLNVQTRLTALEVDQARYNLADKDPAPGYAVRDDGSATKTVRERRGELEEEEARIAEKYEALLPAVAELIESGELAQQVGGPRLA